MYILYMQYAIPSSHAEKKRWGRLNFFKGCITPVGILYFAARILLLKGIPRLQGNSCILKTLSLALNNGRTRRC